MVEVGSVVAVLEKRVADGVIDADLELEVDLVLTDDELDDELTSASAPAPAEETEGMVEFPVRLLKLGASLFKTVDCELQINLHMYSTSQGSGQTYLQHCTCSRKPKPPTSKANAHYRQRTSLLSYEMGNKGEELSN